MNAFGRTGSIVCAILVIGVSSVNSAHSAGFALIEHSASGMGNAFAGAAAIGEDASSVFFNPAAMNLLTEAQLVAGLHFISPSADFTDTGSSTAQGDPLTGGAGDGGANAFVPNLYYVLPLSADIRFGIGINVPFGLAVTYDDDWKGRYHGVESELKTININPSVSFQLSEKVSFGYGINMQSADVILSSAIDFGSICEGVQQNTCGLLPQQADGFGYLEGKDSLSFGWNVGLLFQISEAARLGFSYRSPISHDITGSANFTVPDAAAYFTTEAGRFVDTGLRAKLRTPDVISASYVHKLSPTVTFLSDITFTGWSNFEELRIRYDNPQQPDTFTTEEWRDSWRYSVGANFIQSKKLMLRCGLAYDETPVPNDQRRTPRVPDNSRTWLSFGVHYALNASLLLDVGYSHLFISDAKIDNTIETDTESLQPYVTANLNGEYTSSVDILSAQLTWKF